MMLVMTMPKKSTFDVEKALNAVLYVAEQLRLAGKEAGFHQVFKILYFAEQKHIAQYGSFILGDSYVAMPKGPVPSKTYDILKALRQDLPYEVDIETITQYVRVEDEHYIQPVGEVDESIFSDTELASLMLSVQENKDLSFGKLTEKSHDAAWEKAAQTSKNDIMSFVEIARAGGANEEMIKFIEEDIENKNFFAN